MEQKDLIEIIDKLKVGGELPFLEAKLSNSNKEYIGKTISAISNSASYYNQDHGYIIWGIQNKTWSVVGTHFDIKNFKEGNQLIFSKILDSLNRPIAVSVFDFLLEGKKIQVLRISSCGNEPIAFNKIAYFRVGEANDELLQHPQVLSSIIMKKEDWTGDSLKESSLSWLDQSALDFIKEKYLEINPEKKDDTIVQILNSLSLLKNGAPNNSCLLFLGKSEILERVFLGKQKISWRYIDDIHKIEERLTVSESQLPFIQLLPIILDKINKFNTTLSDITLFREDIKQYDNKAIEELLINAIAHRDWQIDFWIEIIQTPASLEFRNPGVFRANLDKVLMENDRPKYLNPTLATFLRKIKLMEQEGGGLIKAYSAQIKKGLSIELKESSILEKVTSDPKVIFLMQGKVSNISFASFILSKKNLTESQIVILDRINTNKKISSEEYAKVKDFVSRVGRGGAGLKIKEHLLLKSNNYIKGFSSTHASQNTARELILDYAKKNNSFTTSEIYDVLNGKSREWVRACLAKMKKEGSIETPEKRGVYTLKKDDTTN